MLLARIKAPVAHHFVENKFLWHPTHVLSSAGALVLLIASLQSNHKNLTLVSILLLEIKLLINRIYWLFSAIFGRFLLHAKVLNFSIQ
jgi:hypothetical protein